MGQLACSSFPIDPMHSQRTRKLFEILHKMAVEVSYHHVHARTIQVFHDRSILEVIRVTTLQRIQSNVLHDRQ